MSETCNKKQQQGESFLYMSNSPYVQLKCLIDVFEHLFDICTLHNCIT